MIRFCLIAILLCGAPALALDNFNETAKYTSLSFKLPSDALLPSEKLYVVDTDKNALMVFAPGQTTPLII
ncbi:MAG TPA: hypothetical protein PLL10_03910, partial [Elusimicrobiales bacterium]|nr:hypothetical protein [Elusimicrobiales bacterium]